MPFEKPNEGPVKNPAEGILKDMEGGEKLPTEQPKAEALSTGEELSAEVANKIVAAFQQNGKVDQYKEKIADKNDKASNNKDKEALARHREANTGFVKDVTAIGWVAPLELTKDRNPAGNITNATSNMCKKEFNYDVGTKIEWNTILDDVYKMGDGAKRKYVAKLDKFLAVMDKAVKAMG